MSEPDSNYPQHRLKHELSDMSSDYQGGTSSSSTSGSGNTFNSPAAALAPPPPRKIAIPRLSVNDGRSNSLGSEHGGASGGNDVKNRVSHACEPCRQRKTKCSGERPMCRHCEEFRISCFYGQGKRDRAKSEIINLQRRIDDYEKLLEEVSQKVDGSTQRMILEAIGKPEVKSTPKLLEQPLPNADPPPQNPGTEDTSDGVPPLPAEFKIIPGHDRLTTDGEHLSKSRKPNLTDGQAATRMRKCDAIGQLTATAMKNVILQDNLTLVAPSYYLDDIDIFIIGDQVDPYKLPPKDVSDTLIKYYFDTVHPIFPILLDELFLAQYESFYEFPFAPESSERWLSLLNLVLAISHVYSQMVDPVLKVGDCDHLHYFARARLLSADAGWGMEAADLQQIQVCGLMGMYLMATSHPIRAWSITSLAIRYGKYMHLDSSAGEDDADVTETEKTMRIRIWFAIRSLDQMLVVLTGRPPVIADQSVGQPFLDVIANELPAYSSTTNSITTWNPNTLSTPYFTQYSKISAITVETINALYCPETMKMTWIEVQEKIMELTKSLEDWRTQLPPDLDYRQLSGHEDSGLKIHVMALALQYFNTQIIINRPALGRSDGKISKLSWPVESFNHNMATSCIDAARQTIRLIFSSPVPSTLYASFPWWHLLHYLTLAGSIVILEISMRAEHNPSQASELYSDATKVIGWMKIQGKYSATALKAWAMLSRLLSAAAPKIGYEFNAEAMLQGEPIDMVGIDDLLLQKVDADYSEPEQRAQLSPSINKFNAGPRNSISSTPQEFDDYPSVHLDHEYHTHPIIDSTSMMFPTPLQMHGIDVEESFSRRQSIASANSAQSQSTSTKHPMQHLRQPTKQQQQQQQHQSSSQQSQQTQQSQSHPTSPHPSSASYLTTAAGISIDSDIAHKMFGFSTTNAFIDHGQSSNVTPTQTSAQLHLHLTNTDRLMSDGTTPDGSGATTPTTRLPMQPPPLPMTNAYLGSSSTQDYQQRGQERGKKRK